MSPRHRHPRGEDAQAMVEFALVVPVLMLVVLGLMTLGHTFGKQLDLKGATRDAARRAAVSMNNPAAVTVSRQALYNSLALTRDNDVTMTITPGPPWNHGDVITVRTSTPHSMRIMGVTVWSGQLRAESEIRVE